MLTSGSTRKASVQCYAKQTAYLHHLRSLTIRNHQVIQDHSIVTSAMVEHIGLLTVQYYLYGRQRHEARSGPKPGAQNKNGKHVPPGWSSSLQATEKEIQSYIQGNQLLLDCCKKIPLLSNVRVQPLSGAWGKMLVVVLGETGFDSTVIRFMGVPIKLFTVYMPYLSGQVEAQCLPKAI